MMTIMAWVTSMFQQLIHYNRLLRVECRLTQARIADAMTEGRFRREPVNRLLLLLRERHTSPVHTHGLHHHPRASLRRRPCPLEWIVCRGLVVLVSRQAIPVGRIAHVTGWATLHRWAILHSWAILYRCLRCSFRGQTTPVADSGRMGYEM